MNKTLLNLIFLLILVNTIEAQNLMREDFEYPVMPDLAGIGGWFQSGINSPHNINVVSPSLEFPGHPGSFVGNKILFSNITGGDVLLRDIPSQNSGAVYLSCILAVDTLTDSATSGYNLALDEAGSTTNIGARLMIQRYNDDSCRFGINKLNSTAYTSKIYNNHILIAAVVKYVFVNGSNNDSCKLYIFTFGIPLNEPSVPDAMVVGGSDAVNFGQVVLSNSYSQSGLRSSLVQMDAIRIGKSWQTSILASVQSVSLHTPDKYKLEQNYPNPFNPSTTINFSIIKRGNVKISVYDVSGRLIENLVNEELNSGAFSVDFNASDYSSGTYFYQLRTGDFVETKKMILIK